MLFKRSLILRYNEDNIDHKNETFEPLDISPEQQIYNPIFDEFPPKHPHYLDLEQYIAVERTIPKEWNITGILFIPIVQYTQTVQVTT